VKTPDSNDEKIFQLIKNYIPTAKMETNVAAELSFILPKEHTHRQGSRHALHNGVGPPETTVTFPGFFKFGKQILATYLLRHSSQNVHARVCVCVCACVCVCVCVCKNCDALIGACYRVIKLSN
jgi:hypothetical protein